ncbi:MAG: hypothetical protein ACR2IL_00290 [Chitinophagaceae bacterium]
MNSLNDIIEFGKHKGKTINEILLLDPAYIGWLCYATDSVLFSREDYDYIFKYLFENHSSFYSDFKVIEWSENNPSNYIAELIEKYGKLVELQIQSEIKNKKNVIKETKDLIDELNELKKIIKRN